MAAKTLPPARTWIFTSVYALLASIAIYGMRILPQLEFGVDKHIEQVTTTGQFPNGVPLRREYTGIAAVDFGLSFLVIAFSGGTYGWDCGFQLQQIYFLFSFFAVISIWEVEAYRARNGKVLGTFLWLWTLAYQTVGGAVIVPLYYLAYTWVTSKPSHFSQARKIPLSVAKTLLPALGLGYLAPTVALFWPWKNVDTAQGVTALWQPAPLFPIVLLTVFPMLLSDKAPTESPNDADLKHLKRFYTCVGVVTTCVHFAELYVFLVATVPGTSFKDAFLLDFNIAKTSPVKGLLYTFQIDFWITFASSLIWCWQAVWDLRELGATDIGLLQAAVLIALGSSVFGPGATMCGVWYWREHKMGAFCRDDETIKNR